MNVETTWVTIKFTGTITLRLPGGISFYCAVTCAVVPSVVVLAVHILICCSHLSFFSAGYKADRLYIIHAHCFNGATVVVLPPLSVHPHSVTQSLH